MDRFGGPGAALWARNDLRRRWLSLTILGILAGLSAALAIAAVSGARRADTAFARLDATTVGADAVIFPSQTGASGPFAWDELRDQPYVEDVAPWSLTFGTLFPDSEAPEPQTVFFTPGDEHWYQTTERPIVLEGRMWDPAADSEAVIDESVADEFGVQVGDHLPLRVYEAGQFATGDPAGPTLDIEVVGIVRQPSRFLFTEGMVVLSPGTHSAHPEMERIENAHVRLRDPAHDVTALRRGGNELLAPGTPVLDLASVLRRIGTAITLERTAQLLLAAAVAVAGLVFVGQALARSVAQIDEDATVLRAVGMTGGERAAAATRPHVLVVAVAVPVALLGAWLASPRFPIGYARTVDPTVGYGVDWVVAGPGLLLTAVFLGGGAYVVGRRHSRRVDATETVAPSRLAAALRAGTPASVGLGTTMAFEAGRGRRRLPVGPALLGAVAGVLGVVATLTISRGIDDALDNPERAGVQWDATALGADGDFGDEPNEVDPAFADALDASDDVAAAAVFGRNVLPIDGVGIPVFDVKPVAGDIELVVTDGSPPAADDEVALGRETAEQLGVGIGDAVTIEGEATRELEVVGIALFPHDVHSGFTEGAWVTSALLADVSVPTDSATLTGAAQLGVVRWAEEADPVTALAEFQERMGFDRAPSPAQVPPELVNLKRVRSVPLVLVGFLVLLAISALAHVLVTSIRRRRQEFAVLRSVGFTRLQTATVVASQGTCVGLVGLLLGIPLGLALGRVGWSWVAETVPLVYVSPVKIAAVLLVVPAALVITNAIAAYPAQRIARLRTAEALRTE